MDEIPRTEPRPDVETNERERRESGRGRWFAWALAAVVVAFFAGFLWQYFEASSLRSELEATERELRVERMRIQLAQAAIDAQAGEFERARQQMSAFFTEIGRDPESLPDRVRRVSEGFLSRRDDVITGLSRSNAEYAAVLFGMLDRLNAAAGAMAPAGRELETPLGDTTGAGVVEDTGT